jgi:hypothetical protein
MHLNAIQPIQVPYTLKQLLLVWHSLPLREQSTKEKQQNMEAGSNSTKPVSPQVLGGTQSRNDWDFLILCFCLLFILLDPHKFVHTTPLPTYPHTHTWVFTLYFIFKFKTLNTCRSSVLSWRRSWSTDGFPVRKFTQTHPFHQVMLKYQYLNIFCANWFNVFIADFALPGVYIPGY